MDKSYIKSLRMKYHRKNFLPDSVIEGMVQEGADEELHDHLVENGISDDDAWWAVNEMIQRQAPWKEVRQFIEEGLAGNRYFWTQEQLYHELDFFFSSQMEEGDLAEVNMLNGLREFINAAWTGPCDVDEFDNWIDSWYDAHN